RKGNHAVLALSPDGKTLASGSGGGRNAIRLWDVTAAADAPKAVLPHDGGLTALAWSPDGKTLASGGRDLAVRFWDVAARRAHRPVVLGHPALTSDLAWAPDGKALATAEDGFVRRWDVATGEPAGTPLNQGNFVRGLAWSPDGMRLATATGPGGAWVWPGPA